VTKSRNLLRVVVIIWLALSLRSGFVTWTDHENATVHTAVTPANPQGLAIENLAYRCAAPMRSDKPAVQVEPAVVDTPPTSAPCSLRAQRQALFWIDIVFGLAALGVTFAHIPRRWLDARRDVVVNAA
jgi:hypothetical protein